MPSLSKLVLLSLEDAEHGTSANERKAAVLFLTVLHFRSANSLQEGGIHFESYETD